MFETQRLILRGVRKADLDAMFAIHNDYDVQKTASSRYIVPRPEEPQKANLEEWATKCTLFAVAEDKETGHTSGTSAYGSMTLASNKRATAVYKKVGFVEEGRKRKAIWREGQYVDEITMGVLGEDFWATESQTTEA